jgi:uncharacterized protein YprB with RNaseH-like and TPR domain
LKTKILIWDIETTHLKADFGTVLCIGYKWLGDRKTHVITITDFPNWKKDVTDDSRIFKAFYPILIEADMWVTYFGTGFDRKYIQSKLLEHRLDFLPNSPHVDLFYAVKGNMNLSRKSLQTVGLFLGCKAEKSPVSGKVWKKAMVGDEASIDYVRSHCLADVKLTEEVYLRLRPLVRQHPRVSDLGSCRVCGSNRLTLQGRYIAVTSGPANRVKCMDCGAWDRRKI